MFNITFIYIYCEIYLYLFSSLFFYFLGDVKNQTYVYRFLTPAGTCDWYDRTKWYFSTIVPVLLNKI